MLCLLFAEYILWSLYLSCSVQPEVWLTLALLQSKSRSLCLLCFRVSLLFCCPPILITYIHHVLMAVLGTFPVVAIFHIFVPFAIGKPSVVSLCSLCTSSQSTFYARCLLLLFMCLCIHNQHNIPVSQTRCSMMMLSLAYTNCSLVPIDCSKGGL